VHCPSGGDGRGVPKILQAVSVFTEAELKDFYKTRKYPVILTFTYNVSFPKRVTRKVLLEELGLDAKARWHV
jgi:hypothetical protein